MRLYRPRDLLVGLVLLSSHTVRAMQSKRTSLADPSRGLAWSNRQVSDEVLVRNALQHGAYYLVLDAVLEFGLAFVRQQWALMLADDDAAPSSRAQADIERKLTNIERGLREAGV